MNHRVVDHFDFSLIKPSNANKYRFTVYTLIFSIIADIQSKWPTKEGSKSNEIIVKIILFLRKLFNLLIN